MSRALRRSVAALALLGPAAGTLHGQVVAEVQVIPQTLTLQVGEKQQVFAAAFDRQGNLIANARFTFWSSDTLVARVERDGHVIGIRPGVAKVEARTQGGRASLAVLVAAEEGSGDSAVAQGPAPAPVPGAALTLDPAIVRLLPGEAVRIKPQALRSDGTSLDPGRVFWKSLRPEVATIDSNGVVIGVAPGRSVVQATTSRGLVATAPVEVDSARFVLTQSRIVLPPDGLDTVQAVVPAQGNRPLTSGISWRSTDTAVARVGPTGVVQGRSPGTAEIIVSGLQGEQRASVIVHPPVKAIVVTPRPTGTPLQLPLGAPKKFEVVAQTADGSPIPDVRVQWEVVDTAIASFDPATGQLTGKALGTTSLTAQVASFPTVAWPVTVVPNRLRLDRSRLGLSVRDRVSVGAFLLDEQDRVVGPPQELLWTSDRPDVAAIDPQGVIEGRAPGRATITAATPWGATARLEVFVVGDLVVASNRTGTFGLYQVLPSAPDSFVPLLVDSASNLSPALSPDRTRIAFSSNRAGGDYDLYVMDADGRNLRRLTAERGRDDAPVWMPDGSAFVFVSTRTGDPQLFVMGADSGGARQLTDTRRGNHSPAISPDGKTIAFVSLRDGEPRVYRMPMEGGPATRVGSGDLREASPRFFPNGDLAYAVERSRGASEWRIVRIRDGTDPVPVLQTDGPIVGFATSRDGKRIAYVTARSARGRTEHRLHFLRGVTIDATSTPIRLRPGEQVSGLSF